MLFKLLEESLWKGKIPLIVVNDRAVHHKVFVLVENKVIFMAWTEELRIIQVVIAGEKRQDDQVGRVIHAEVDVFHEFLCRSDAGLPHSQDFEFCSNRVLIE